MDKKLNKSELYIIKGMLSIYNNFSNLLAESQTDELTGLMNRKTFDESIVKLYQHFSDPMSQEGDQAPCTWLAIIDIDLFKHINDKYGHLYGDEILIHMARTLQQAFKPTDLLFRFGGEEFVVVLKDQTKQECMQSLENLRLAVERILVNEGEKLSVSIGATRFDHTVFHITLLDHADKALYFSKDNGRNQITFYEDMKARGLVEEEELESGDIDLF
ncbi:GGDEF domain-containing protein [Maribrevibacterium harenarium]|uniref:GGDEF domain-containing protein n=1 Tax=Maribrevibacterium harenarium TaxID=2589817 RepID=UPI0015E3A0E2|nr:GGDEF domain-containing protein [Maribrevibacterium harenarium]